MAKGAYVYVLGSHRAGGILNGRYYRTLYGAMSEARRLARRRKENIQVSKVVEEVCWPTMGEVSKKGRVKCQSGL